MNLHSSINKVTGYGFNYRTYSKAHSIDSLDPFLWMKEWLSDIYIKNPWNMTYILPEVL
jgi:hypothetical protein